MMMADPYDPEQRELIRRQDANWRALPIILGVVFLFALGFLLLSESHLSVHTFPETGFAAFDRPREPGERPQEHHRAGPGKRALSAGGPVGDAVGIGQDRDGDVVQARAPAGGLADESTLERGRHADEDAFPRRSASSQSASSLAHQGARCLVVLADSGPTRRAERP
jgi:hypothetical protein